MTPEFNRWWDADELMQTNPYPEDTPVWWAWEGWQAARAESAKEIEELKAQVNGMKNVRLNIRHRDCHKAADAFWKYWKENGETHKNGYYEATWGAINSALKVVGVIDTAQEKPND